jgi:hypothetical protein
MLHTAIMLVLRRATNTDLFQPDSIHKKHLGYLPGQQPIESTVL